MSFSEVSRVLLDLLTVSFSFSRSRFSMLSETLTKQLSKSMSAVACESVESEICRDDAAALTLKFVAIAAILVAGVTGIAIPLIGKKGTDGNLFVAVKAFAAGVILATGFVHMLPDGSSNLTNPCLPEYPWAKFPFSGFVTMFSALMTLLADFMGTQFYERRQEKNPGRDRDGSAESVVLPVDRVQVKSNQINGIDYGLETRDRRVIDVHDSDHEDSVGRHAVVSQVLELGIISHSIIIGISLGVSHSPCAIRPLIAALSFHQFFEGFALGGCISGAEFKTVSVVVMACFFALTNPIGIAVGIGISSFYNPESPRALVVEGILDCVSAGILIYMALVDLIAADFLSKRMRSNGRLQIASYFGLFLGAALMSLLAIWS